MSYPSVPWDESRASILVIADLDHTLLQGDSYRRMLRTLYFKYPSRWPVVVGAAVCRKLRLISLKRFKEISLMPFCGWSYDRIQSWGRQFYTDELKAAISDQARMVLQRHKKSGHKLVLATGAPDVYLQSLASDLEFDDVICTQLEYNSGRFTGKILGADCLGNEKLKKVRQYAKKQGFDLRQAYMYTDHHSDLPLLYHVGNPHAVNPSVELKTCSVSQNWQVLYW